LTQISPAVGKIVKKIACSRQNSQKISPAAGKKVNKFRLRSAKSQNTQKKLPSAGKILK